MFATRVHSGFCDENKRVDGGKAAVPARAAAGVGARNTRAAQATNRSALGDIGNLIDAMSVRCNMKEGIVEPVLKQAVQQSEAFTRPITRRFGATFQDNQVAPALVSVAVIARHAYDADMHEAEEPVPNIDEHDTGNQFAVVEYIVDIYGFYRKTEIQSCVPADYMSRQSDINEKMRAIIIDWLIEVNLKFKLMPETLFLTTNLIDRYLCVHSVSRKNLQLVGVTAMLLAAKYEEIWAPEVNDFVHISDNAYIRDEVLTMEKNMLNTLKFNLTVPTPYVFILRLFKAATFDKQESTVGSQLEMVAWFLVELCLSDYSMIQYAPSLLAAAAVYTAQVTVDRESRWGPALQKHSGYAEAQIMKCAALMANMHSKAGEGNLTVVHKKYSLAKLLGVAKLPQATSLCTAQSNS